MLFSNPLRKITKTVTKINNLGDSVKALSNEELRAKTAEFKSRLDKGETLESILPEAFAVCREATDRVLGKRPYDVQMMAGIALHNGSIAEQKTGEGKTITEIAPAYLNALTGNGVHIVTVNDYLAERDMQEMGRVFKFLNMTVSWIYPKMDPELKKQAYKCDIVYGTNKEFGFDYLRDNMAKSIENTYQQKLNFAIIDEVDSILIDEARTPLIISGEGEESTDVYVQADRCVKTLIRGEDPKDLTKIESIMENLEETELTPEEIEKKGDFTVNERENSVVLTDRGVKKVEEYFGIANLGDAENTMLSHHINQALRANNLMLRDKNYIVKNDEVLIVDDFTGRVLSGRRYSDGLHQAIEAKEGVTIQKENQTMATISLQNYFRLYTKISGMTGTAATERTEFKDIYKLDVVEVPTNKPVIRKDMQDRIYQTENAKFNAIMQDIIERSAKHQPVLVGTPTIEQSEKLSRLLKRNGIKHNVLNAKNHEREAEIIAQAGKLDAVTIATNMAGRGTDIMLGGNPEFKTKARMIQLGYDEDMINIASSLLPTEVEEEQQAKDTYRKILEEEKQLCNQEAEEVKKVGGLHVLGTARHEARRIDNQLRGRSGRQGDPGSSQFFISLEDDVIRLFAGDSIKNMIARLGIPEDTPIDNVQMSKAVETAQKRFETKNFEARKSTLEYDDVNDTQRKVIYSLRREILEGKDMSDIILDMIDDVAENIINDNVKDKTITPEELFTLNEFLKQFLRVEHNVITTQKTKKEIISHVKECFHKQYKDKIAEVEKEKGDMAYLQRQILLTIIDRRWIAYITAMQNLRDSVSLVSYGNEKPVDAYKREAYTMFNSLIDSIKEATIRGLLTVAVKRRPPVKLTMQPVKINLDNLGKKEPTENKSESGIVIKTKEAIPPFASPSPNPRKA